MKNKWWINFFVIIIISVLFSVSCANKDIRDSSPTQVTPDVSLTWAVVPEATSYNIYYSDKPGVTKKNGIKISNVKSPHKITGLKKGEKYFFVVTAINDSGESEESKEISCIVGQ